MRKERQTAQLTFADPAGVFKLPDVLGSQIPRGSELVNFLETRKPWQGQPEGYGLFWNQGKVSNRIFVFNPKSWQIIADRKLEEINGLYSSLLVISPTGDLANQSEITEGLDFLIRHLKKNSPCYVVELKNQMSTGGEELNFLAGRGLFHKKILKKAMSEFLVFESKSKAFRRRKPIDLTDEQKYPRAYVYTQRLLKETEKKYAGMGFELIDFKKSAIWKRLKASKNPPADWSLLSLGHGITIRNKFCGCTLSINLDGNEEFIWRCQEKDKDHLGKMTVQNKKEFIVKETVLEIRCGDCGDKIYQMIERSYGQEQVIRFCRRCDWQVKI